MTALRRGASGAAGQPDLSVSLDEGLATYNTAEARALARLDASALELRSTRPRHGNGNIYSGRVPANIGSMKPESIGEYYGLQIEYTDYVEGQIVLARAEMTAAEAKLDLTRAAVRQSKLGTAQEKIDQCTIDVRYVQANADYIEARTYFELITAIGEAARRDAKFISRIIETKRLEIEMAGRAGSIRQPVGERGANRYRREPYGTRHRDDEDS